MTTQLDSPNFAFLSRHDAILVRHAALAERYVFDDPNSALLKLRQFGELLASHTSAYVGIAPEERESQVQVLDKLWNRGSLNPKVSQLFHGLRKAGNDAAHAHADDRREALYQLRMAHKLAVWFHRSFKDKNFAAGPFVPPPDPSQAQAELTSELKRLREEVVSAQEEAAGAKAAAQERQTLADEAEQAAATAYSELDAALEIAAETEQQIQVERTRFEQSLAELQQSAASSPETEQTAVTETARSEGELLELSEADTRHIIDAQLREAGWEADSQLLLQSNGTRPAKGRNLAIAEWQTSNGPADYVLFIGLMPVAVVEAKRAKLNVAGAIEQAKRYSRGFEIEDLDLPGGPWGDYDIPFLFSTNGRQFLRQLAEVSGVWFLDARRETNHPRALDSWYTPEGLKQLLDQDIEQADERLRNEPTDYLPLRDYQSEAVRCVEQAIANGQQEILVAMATGTGKTITCIGLIYRLIKAKRFRRILFLVDRSALGEQTLDKLKDVRLENLQTFPDIYDVKELGDLKPDTDTKLQIATVQGMVMRLLFPNESATPVPVDWYDCVIIDECHRGYNLDMEMSDAEMEFRSEADYISKYRRVIDHFDATRIGLTATPALHTTGIADQAQGRSLASLQRDGSERSQKLRSRSPDLSRRHACEAGDCSGQSTGRVRAAPSPLGRG